ncbi:winged helix-turn-helix transcriptional regulator [Candidatus Pacearchaeota archaeon]|nr:winged helix-turn-helix transcriptional regulator [Candidatus Pacearchaeota archaeon]
MTLQNEVYHTDKDYFESNICPKFFKKEGTAIFCSFTHITSTYVLLFTLKELKRVAEKTNSKVIILMWDMNTLVNPFYKKLVESRKVTNSKEFINDKYTELENIILSLGFKKDSTFLYKSSDLWKRLISYKEEDIFQNFYSIMARMKADDFLGHKCSHIIQDTMDIFFCNYFHKLCPEDSTQPIDIIFFGDHKMDIYEKTRNVMLNEGIISTQSPLFFILRKFPFLMDKNFNLPNWDHSRKQILEMIKNSKTNKKELLEIFNLFEGENVISENIKSDKLNLEINELSEFYKTKKINDIEIVISNMLYLFLQDKKKSFLEQTNKIEEKITTISNFQELQNMGKVMKSKISIRILILANGESNLTKIAKTLGKSVATISMYVKDLKELDLIRTLKNGCLKRNIKGIKINFENIEI